MLASCGPCLRGLSGPSFAREPSDAARWWWPCAAAGVFAAVVQERQHSDAVANGSTSRSPKLQAAGRACGEDAAATSVACVLEQQRVLAQELRDVRSTVEACTLAFAALKHRYKRQTRSLYASARAQRANSEALRTQLSVLQCECWNLQAHNSGRVSEQDMRLRRVERACGGGAPMHPSLAIAPGTASRAQEDVTHSLDTDTVSSRSVFSRAESWCEAP